MLDKFDGQQGVEGNAQTERVCRACDYLERFVGRPLFGGVKVCWREKEVQDGFVLLDARSAFDRLFGYLLEGLVGRVLMHDLGELSRFSLGQKVDLFLSDNVVEALKKTGVFSEVFLKGFANMTGVPYLSEEGAGGQVGTMMLDYSEIETSVKRAVEEAREAGQDVPDRTRVLRVADVMEALREAESLRLVDTRGEEEDVSDGTKMLMAADVLEAVREAESLGLVDTRGGEADEVDEATAGTVIYGDNGQPSLADVLRIEVIKEVAREDSGGQEIAHGAGMEEVERVTKRAEGVVKRKVRQVLSFLARGLKR